MGLSDFRARFFKQFPAAERLDQALRTSSNPSPVFFMESINNDSDLKNSGFALLRLGEDLERRFGINGEIAAYFLPWRDFQRRSFNAITMRTPELARSLQESVMLSERFTPSRRVAILVSNDPRVSTKLDEWQNDSLSELTVIPVDPTGSPEESLLPKLILSLRQRLGERDLYQTQNPVSGMDFFGRSGLLRNLTAAIEGDQNIAILGLRRSGKTSVLRELRRILLPRRIVMPIADFQMLENRSVEDVASTIASSLNEELKVAKSKGVDVWIGDISDQAVDDMTPVALSDRIKRVASRNSSIRIVVAVDEIESAAAIARANPTSIKVLLGALRSAAQAKENVSLMFSGVANRMFRSSSLGDQGSVDNPMFNQVASIYLTPFTVEETTRLLRELGRPMLLDWTDEAILEVHRLTGGFPYFVRDLASTVRQAVRARVATSSADLVPVTERDVTAGFQNWAGSAAEGWSGIVDALGIHYPAAAALLDASLTEDELNEWISGDTDAHSAYEDLLALELLEHIDSRIAYTSTLAALRELGRSGDPGTPVNSDAEREPTSFADLVRRGESQFLEFKETSRFNVATRAKDSRMEDAVVKTVAAFLNSEGGDLLIGISDEGSAKGLGPDLNLFGGSLDRYERWLRGDLLARRIDQQLVTDHVRTGFVNFRGKTIARVTVSRSDQPAWVDDKIIYRRMGNQTVALDSGRDVQAFITNRQNS